MSNEVIPVPTIAQLISYLETKTPGEVRNRLLSHHGIDSETAHQIVKEAKDAKAVQDAIKEKQERKSRLAASRQHLVENDTGIDSNTVDALEAKIRELLDEEDLQGFNDDLKLKGRQLTYREIAVIGCIHKMRIETQRGQSPFKGFSDLAIRGKLTDKPLDNRQLRYAFTILEAIGMTEQTVEHKPPTWKDGKLVAGKSGLWVWNEL